MEKIGVVISSEQDIHAFAVKKAAEELGQYIEIIDTGDFLDTFLLNARFDERGGFLEVVNTLSRCALTSESISGLWWRRPGKPSMQKARLHPGLINAASREASHALFGSLASLVPNSFNVPDRSRFASQKQVQLALASRLGLRIPQTLITSDPDSAADFISGSVNGAIYKLFNGTDVGFFETRRVKPADAAEYVRISMCPVLLQEYVEGDFDVRVTIVGHEIFAARLDFDNSSDIADSRFTATRVSRTELPENLRSSLLKFMSTLGLRYGTIDLRYSKAVGYTFFEVNPEGQYLWTEIEADLQISHAIALQILNDPALVVETAY